MKTLFKNGIVITKDENDTVLRPGWILIQNDSITNLGGGNPPLETENDADKVVDMEGNIIVPGFINCHTHFSQALLKGFSEGLTLESWLNTIIRPFQKEISVNQKEFSTQFSIAENLLNGVTTIVQHHKITTAEHVNVTIETASKMGARVAFMLGCNNASVEKEGIRKYINNTRTLIKSYGPEYSFGFGPKSIENCSQDLLAALADASREFSIPCHVHVAETKTEREYTISRYKQSPVRWLNSIDALNEFSQLVHCNWVDDDELDIIKDKNAYVIHCPINNLYLGSGIARIDKMLQHNIPVVIGTDGSGSGVSQDILGNLKVASLLLKSFSLNPNISSASQCIYMITKLAGQMIGRKDIGHISPGAKADLVMFNVKNIRQQPIHDPQVTLVFNSHNSNISMVMVNGNILVDNGILTQCDGNYILSKLNSNTFGDCQYKGLKTYDCI